MSDAGARPEAACAAARAGHANAAAAATASTPRRRRASSTAAACPRSPTASATTRSSAPACTRRCRPPTFPALRALRTRDDDDFTIGLLDAFACSADVLTFYQERIANESYLRTATERVSLQELGKLIGYRLRPGVAAETWLAFALETPPTPPADLAPEPGNFVTGVPAKLTLDVGTQGAERARVPTRSRRPSRRSRRSRRAPRVERDAAVAERGPPPGARRRGRPGWPASPPTSSPATRCCSSATSSSPASAATPGTSACSTAVEADDRERPHARRLGARPGRIGSRSRTRPRSRVCSCCASARPCSATTRRCGAAWIRGSAAATRPSSAVPPLPANGPTSPSRRVPPSATAGRSISTRSSPRSRPMFRATSRVAASPCSPRAASIGPTRTFRPAPTSSSTA